MKTIYLKLVLSEAFFERLSKLEKLTKLAEHIPPDGEIIEIDIEQKIKEYDVPLSLIEIFINKKNE